MNKPKYVFEYAFRQHDDNKENNIINHNDQHLNNLKLQLDFKYYQNHEFHKLSQSFIKNKTLSILHTKICSLEGNAEKVVILNSNLEFNFYVITVSETWTSCPRENIKSRIIDGYQTYHRTKGHTLKRGCGFFIKNGLKFHQWTDLDLRTIDENNEFQPCWIEIINNPNCNILIGCYYRHSRKFSNEVFLEKKKLPTNNLIVCGDFNYNLLHHEHNEFE